ncbi:MAG: PPC domain-containing protein, partial [Planctomycetota bacterium]|nr:PPC domain-containing protein [Planctomycetota bacterium]
MPEPSGLLKFLTVFAAGVAALSGGGRLAHAEPAPAVLNSVFPAGGQRGTSVEVAVEGAGIEGADRLLCGEPRIVAKRLAPGRFQITIPESVRTGSYDVRAVGAFGISSPRTFVVGRLREQAESQPNDNPADAEKVELDSTLNGRIEKAGDVDCYRFEARKGQRVVVDCFADRIDSQLRAVVDVTGPMGTRVMAARESPRLDPVVDFVAPESGEYFARIHDLSFAGGANHFYRLEIDTGSRFEYAIPPVIQAGVATRVAVYGRNLPANPLWIEVTAPAGDPDASGLRLAATQVDADLLTCHLPDGNAPLPLSVTDVAVRGIGREHRTQGNPYPIDAPCEAAGQLIQGDEQAWFELTARSGEVFWL